MNYFVPLRNKAIFKMIFFNKRHNKQTDELPSQAEHIDFDRLNNGDDATQQEERRETQPEAEEKPATKAKPQLDTNSYEVQQIIRQEAKRMRLNEQILSAPHLARIKESLRLNETKMENIEENLARTRNQLERVHRYQELSFELNEYKKHLYEVNKQMAASINDRETLNRFEAFENVQGQYQRLSVLEALRRQNKQHLSELTRDIDTANRELEDETKRLNQQEDEMNDVTRQMSATIEIYSEAQTIESKNAYIQILVHRLSERLASLNNQRTALEKEISEQHRSIQAMEEKIGAIRTRKQSIAPHQQMAEHGELVLERLTMLNDLRMRLTKIEAAQKESLKRQTDENEMLGRVYTDYQQVEQTISALKDELRVHREHNHGLNSYHLQERAMKLKLRREMLLSAQSLWNRIANGYALIEDTAQNINSLRLKKESLTDKISALEKELGVLRRTTHEKEYTFTLSKSQNVIQLRSDLKEGTSCTVCGATHHPYHSDTMLEQNKLISEIKMEYEALSTELRGKEQLLREMQLEHATVSARKEELENTLITLRELQNGYIRDWQMFSNLDHTFADCDSSVNAPARTVMLRQLIENITSDVEKAQKELDTFNFHQNRINELTEQISVQDLRKSELITRLNEVNTGCQVLAVHLDKINTQKQEANDEYSRLFETVDKMITIPDWLSIWQNSHEALIMRIQETIKNCKTLNRQLEEAEIECNAQKATLKNYESTLQYVMADIATTQDNLKDHNDVIEEGEKKLEKLIGKLSSKQKLETSTNDYRKAVSNLKKQQEKVKECSLKYSFATGRHQECLDNGVVFDERAQNERQGVDVWMRQYNANHSPVQYNELEEIFGTDRNWNDMRTELRAIQVDSLLTQARVDKLNSQLVALQAEGNLNGNDTDLALHQLSAQIDTLEGRRREVMLTIASLTQQLNTHTKAEESIKEEKMQEKSTQI